MAWLTVLTDFGELAVLLPLIGITLLWLLFARSRSSVAVAGLGCIALTALAKVSAYACPPARDLHSPSGHTSLSTLVYGGMALITATGTRGARRLLAITGGFAFILGTQPHAYCSPPTARRKSASSW